MRYMFSREARERQKNKLEKIKELLDDTLPEEYHRILSAAAWARPWRPRRKGWANVLDQFLHAAYAAILLLPVLWLQSYLGAVLFGLLAGGIREVEQYFNQDLRIRMLGDRLMDTAAFVVGAVAIYHFFG